MQENQTKQFIVVLILLSLSFKDASWDPQSVPLLSSCLRTHFISLSPREEGPVFLKDLSFFIN